MTEYRDQYENIRLAGIDVAAVSVDEPAKSENVRLDLRLPFPILCDTERRLIAAWGILNEREMGGIAEAAVFVIDRERRVRFHSVDKTSSRVPTLAVVDFLRSGMQGSVTAQRSRKFPRVEDWVRALRNAVRHGVRSPWGK